MMTELIAPVLTVPPTGAPLMLSEVKAHLRVDHNEEDALISALLGAAVSHLDGWSGILGRCIMTQTWRQDYRSVDGGCLRLPFRDIQSLSVQYTDANGADQTMSANDYRLVITHGGAHLELASGASWPSLASEPDAMRVTMVCGFATVPLNIERAILMHVAAMYENRSSQSDKALFPSGYDALTAPFRMISA